METEKMNGHPPTYERLLIIDDEENMRHMLAILLQQRGYHVDTAVDGMEGLEKMAHQAYDCILCDIRMPRMGGMAFLQAVEGRLKETDVIMMSAYGTIETAVEAMKCGAYDYISKPFKADEVILCLKKAEQRKRLEMENTDLKHQIRSMADEFGLGQIIAASKAMQVVLDLTAKAANYMSTVLITGESGTGKELLARRIHFSSSRADEGFVPINCGGIPDTLLESELFGFRKGAFTGANRDKKGLFQEAHKGTLFLDEIGELPGTLQIKLLRVLQDSEIRPIGGVKTRRVDVRVVAATAKDLQKEIRKGVFRDDLFYRLNVFPIHLPPLRDRREDIPALCSHFLQKFGEKCQKKITGIAPEAMAYLMENPWQGNVRELENAIERAVVIAEQPVLSLADFHVEGAASPLMESLEGYSLKAAKRLVEKKLIIKALKATNGNRTKATRLLEISHPSLLSKIKQYKISI